MMATHTWHRIRAGIAGAAAGRDESLRRVAVRLAAQTVILLLVMLVVLEVVVYLITQQAIRGSLETTLRDRAKQQDPTVCERLRLPCGPPGSPGQFGGPGQPPGGPGRSAFPQGGSSGLGVAKADVTHSEASIVYDVPALNFVHGDGYLGDHVLRPQDVSQVVRTHQDKCCSVGTYEGQQYLVYTKPLSAHGRVVGAVQTSISMQQYGAAMEFLLGALLVVALLGLLTSGGVSIVLVGRALQPIRQAIQRQRDFVADAAHELRTPLAIQRTVGEVGMADPSVDELQATVAQMLGENQHLTRLVEDLSLLARTDTNTISIDRRPVDVSSLVTETAAELEPLAAAEGVTLTSDALGQVWALGDIVRLRQLLLILLDNALKHTPHGGTVSVRLSLQGDRARLQVTDSGPGIDPADLPRIFDRFYRADRARTGEGSGLGLAIAKWIVEAHGGQVHAGNAAPHGAMFTVTLPLARAAVVS